MNHTREWHVHVYCIHVNKNPLHDRNNLLTNPTICMYTSAYERMVHVYCIHLNTNPLHDQNDPLTNPIIYMYISAYERMVRVHCTHLNINPLHDRNNPLTNHTIYIHISIIRENGMYMYIEYTSTKSPYTTEITSLQTLQYTCTHLHTRER